MKFSENWLREIANPPVDTGQLVEQLNFLGLEVSDVQPAAPEFDGVVVARIVDVQPHPNADRLQVCMVDIADGEHYQIVCGAANARVGLIAALAKVSAVLPDGTRIKKGKLRGVESFGMLCSAVELGLADKADGLLELASDAPVGMSIRDYLKLDDSTIEIDLTPNRSDCLSITGVAREVAVANECPLTLPEVKVVAAVIDDVFNIQIEAPEACPRYVGRVIKGINTEAQTPHWMVEKLRRSGIRSLHPIVDITNYVMLELGQPMHAFDLNQLNKTIIVRYAKEKETMVLLDGTEATLSTDTLLICDSKGPLAMAGIMGGADSGVSSKTENVLLESAFFTPVAISGKSRLYGLHTDSSHRFERGVDPQLQAKAIERATQLLLDIAGGKAGPLIDVKSEKHMPVSQAIVLREAQIKRVLGYQFTSEEVENILQRLGVELVRKPGAWEALPPSHRFDMRIEVDLIEELARVHGYTRLPRTLPKFLPKQLQISDVRQQQDQLKQVLIQQGYHEVVCYSFVDPSLPQLNELGQACIELRNPISSELAVMRTSLLGGLLAVLAYNTHRQQKSVRIFEIGSRYVKQDADIKEKKLISGLIYGSRQHEAWNSVVENIDFYDLKGDVEKLLAAAGCSDNVKYQTAAHEIMHPGQSAQIYMQGRSIGWLGRIHPQVQQKMGIAEGIFVFELSLDPLLAESSPEFSAISRFPSIRRDIAIEIDVIHSWEAVEACIREAAAEHLVDIRLFDVYQGKNVTSGRKSLAIGLILQEISRTLTDKEITSSVDKILGILNKNLGATLRE